MTHALGGQLFFHVDSLPPEITDLVPVPRLDRIETILRHGLHKIPRLVFEIAHENFVFCPAEASNEHSLHKREVTFGKASPMPKMNDKPTNTHGDVAQILVGHPSQAASRAHKYRQTVNAPPTQGATLSRTTRGRYIGGK